MFSRIIGTGTRFGQVGASTKFYVTTASFITMTICGTPSVALCQPDSPGLMTSKSMSVLGTLSKEAQERIMSTAKTELFPSSSTRPQTSAMEMDQDEFSKSAHSSQLLGLDQLDTNQTLKNTPMPFFVREAVSHATRLGSGGVLGFCSGYALKKTSKSAALIFGAGFVALQALQHQGWIEIKWQAIQLSVESKLDQNGDGKFCEQDAEILWQKLVGSLTEGLGCATGFVPGLLIGFKYG